MSDTTFSDFCPKPQMQPCAGRNCGSTNPNLHSAECFEDYEKATGMAQPEQEPVAWGIIASNTGHICQVELDADEVEGHNPKHIVPLYTSPPAQRSESSGKPSAWVGLTDEERKEIALEVPMDAVYITEAKLKEKNT